MASNGTIAHRFANRDYSERGLKGSSVSIEGRNYYSYSTVFGQWVDLEKKVCLVFRGDTSVTSHKHFLHDSYFPSDVTVLEYDDGGSGYGYVRWHGCDMLGYKDGNWDMNMRFTLMSYYIKQIYEQFENILTTKKKGAERIDFEYWGSFEKVCSLYEDTTVAKFLKTLKHQKNIKGANKYSRQEVRKYNKLADGMKKLVGLLASGERDVITITDALFGEGSYEKYDKSCERFRKAAAKKAQMESLCSRLGIASPYESHRCWGDRMPHNLSAANIRELSAKERVDLHFEALAYTEREKNEDEREKAYNKRKDNAYRWIVGFEPEIDSNYSHSYKDCEKVRNMYTGDVYEVGGEYIYGFYWLDTDMSFDYDSFRKSEDKGQWIADFYTKCKEVADNRKAILTLKRIKAHTKEKEHSCDDDVYLNDVYLRMYTTDAEYNLCAEFIRKQDKHYADEEAQRRAREIERLRREEEERKEKEYMEQVKQEQINECMSRGIEGRRDLWRKHLMGIRDAESYNDSRDDSEFFFGGNVLLRLNLNKDKVETSKGIRIPVEICKKMWKIVSKWHENPACFKPMQIDTQGSGKYMISFYEDDILTAGCHDIAYTEMERMYNEIINLEA